MSSIEFQMVMKLMDIVVAAAQTAPELVTKYKSARTRIDSMIAEGREPTAAEWAELDNDIDGMRDVLRQYN